MDATEQVSKRGRPPRQPVAPGTRGKMRDGIRQYLSRDGRTVRYQVKVSARDPATGAISTSWQTFESKGDAERARDAQRYDRARGRFVSPNKTTVSEWLEEFLAANAAGVRRVTVERNADRAAHIRKHLGATKLQALAPEAIQRFDRAMAADGLAARTRRSILVLLKSACGLAVARGKLKANPFGTREARAVAMPKPDGGETAYSLSADDVAAILRIFADSELWLGVAVLAYTGLRRGELYALRWRSIDFERGTLHVGGTVARTKNGLSIEAPKAERSRRTIPVDPGILKELRRRKAEQAAIGLRLGIAQSDDWLVFASPDRPTEPKNPSGFCQGFKHKLQRSSYAHVSPHDLRHAHGSILLAQGVSLPTVAGRLGHSTAVCANVYAHEIAGHDAAAMVKFGLSVAESGGRVPGAPAGEPEKMLKVLTEKAA